MRSTVPSPSTLVRRSLLLGLAALAGCSADVQQAPEASLDAAPEAGVERPLSVKGTVTDPEETATEEEAPKASVEVLFLVRGTVTDPEETATEEEALEVGVLWLNRLDSGEVLVEATPAYGLGTALPASFDVSVIAPPSDALLGNYLYAYSEGGAQIEAVDRDRVGFGVVVVGPAGTLANLPSSTSLSDFIGDRTGRSGLLGQFTYVSPYTVRYVKGATAENLTLHDINGEAYTVDDLGLIDVSAWAAGVNTAVCLDDALGRGWAEPEVIACIEANEARIVAGEAAAAACNEACGVLAEGASEEEAEAHFRCTWDCSTTGDTSGSVGNECLYAWAEANAEAFEAECGTIDYVAADFRNARRIATGESIVLKLGEADARVALGNGGFTFID